MGLFSRKKKIFVSSVTYNLAGDEKDRVRYLPTTVLTKIMSNNQFSMTDALQSALLNGPGIRMRSFARWARTTGYANAIGLQAGQLFGPAEVNVAVLATQIPHDVGQTVSIDYAEVAGADYAYWAEQWMAENHPDKIDGDYELDYIENINTIFIKFTDGTSYSFQPVGFSVTSRYLYANYLLLSTPTPAPPVAGDVVPVASSADYPPTVDWTLESNTATPGSMIVNKTVTTVSTFSDGRPDETSETVTPTTVSFTEQEAVYSKTAFLGSDAGAVDEIVSEKTLQHNMKKPAVVSTTGSTSSSTTLPGGVTKVTTVTTVTESLTDAYGYRIDTQRIVEKRWSERKTLIYRYGTGNAVLNSMFGPNYNHGAYFPFIPVRTEERMLDPYYFGDVYAQNLKAYRKAFGSTAKYNSLITSLETNPSMGDIDYGYIVFGVSLNSRESASLKYIYKFFQTLMQQGYGGGAYDSWQTAWNLADLRMRNWVDWRKAQSNPASPLYGTSEPPRAVYPPAPNNSLNLYSSAFSFNMTISWAGMSELTGTGLGRPGAKTGDVWWTPGYSNEFNAIVYSGGVEGVAPSSYSSATLTWQDSPNTYRSINTQGLHHNYMIYKGKGVDIDILECLNDPEVSGFIIPLNEAAFRSMSLVDATQMSQANAYMVLNSYKVVKQKWYQTGWFKIILVIIVIVITVITAGAGAPSAGLLGAAAAVGASLGFAGVAAIIVGTIANTLAAMLLTQIIMMGATKLFGDKVGAIVGAIASVVAVSVGTSMASGQGITAGFSNLASAENIMKMTVAAGNGLAEYVGADTAKVQAQTEDLLKDYSGKEKEILDAYEQNLGLGQVLFDPILLTDSGRYGFVPETLDTFMGRTLLTGSEIADMTNSLLSNFASMTISTDLS